ncbi:MAG: hypothetical protein ACRDIU_00185 [Actinomycetota bacterium]
MQHQYQMHLLLIGILIGLASGYFGGRILEWWMAKRAWIEADRSLEPPQVEPSRHNFEDRQWT